MTATRTARIFGGVVTLGLAALASGCGSSSSSSSAASNPPAAACPGQASALIGTGTAAETVNETDANVFTPKSLNAKVGDIITFKNTGTAPHTATFSDNDCLSSQDMNGGDAWQIKFTQAGTYNYVCKFHVSLGMTGTIVVS